MSGMDTQTIGLPSISVTARRAPDPNELTIIVNDKRIGGWLRSRVTCGIERCPNDFEIVMAAGFPSRKPTPIGKEFKPLHDHFSLGDECQIMLGDDLVLTGYIDSITPSIDKDSHFITIGGRGKCQDLVDCSAIWPGGQMTDSDILQVARKLAKPYDISVSSAPGQDRGPFIPTFNITYGDTAYSVIEYMCRYRGMLAYELPDGSLHLSRATSTARHYGGLAEGVNIERAQASYSTSLRFQEISVFSLSTNVYQDTGKLSFLVTKVSDTDVTRYRNLFVVMEATGVDLDLRQKRAEWEKSRRYGRSQRVTLITDAWRDAADILYSINTLIGIEAPSLNIPSQRELLISEISYLRDEKGTHCEMVLMPTEAFSLPPVVIQTWPDVKPL